MDQNDTLNRTSEPECEYPNPSSKRSTQRGTLVGWARKSLQAFDDATIEVEKVVGSSEGSSIPATVANLVKSISGSGIVVLALAFLHGGIVASSLLLAIFTVVFGFTFYMVGVSCDIARVYTFRELWTSAFGKKTACVPDLIVLINGSMACLTYVVVIREYLEKAFEGFISSEFFLVKNSWLMLMILGIFLLFPLTSLRKLGPLQYTSIVGLVVTLYVFVVVVASFFGKGREGWSKLNDELVHFDVGMFSTCSTFSAAFSAHVNAPKFYGELKNRSLPRFLKVVVYGFGAAALFFLTFGLAGLGFFGKDIKDNVLYGYDSNPYVMVAWLGMAFSITFTFPLLMSPARDSFFGFFKSLNVEILSNNEGPARIIVTAVLVAFTCITASFGIKLQVLNSLKGIFLSNTICLIIPCIIFLKLSGNAGHGAVDEETPLRTLQEKPRKSVMGYAARVTICFSVVASSVGFLMLTKTIPMPSRIPS